MFDTLCALPLTSELFSQSLHPSSPLLAVGLASGHVQAFRLPSTDSPSPEPESLPSVSPVRSNSATTSQSSTSRTSDNDSGRPRVSSLRRSSSSITPLISSAWRTHRHQGSCRSLAFSPDGNLLYSAGTDGLVKCARSETGRVEAKIRVPTLPSGAADSPCLVNPLTHTAFLLATDGGALHLYDTRMVGASAGSAKSVFGESAVVKPAQTWRPHGDYVTSMSAIPAGSESTSGMPRMLASTGDTTVAVLDVRKGVLGRSREGKEVLTSSCVVGGRVYTGDTGGAMVGWDRSVVREWEDGMGRSKVDVKRHVLTPEGELMEVEAPEGEVVDVMCAMDASVAGGKKGGDMAVLGWDSGRIEVVALEKKGRRGRVESTWMCDETEGVVSVGFDANGRLVAGAGEVVKIYGYKGEDAIESDDDDEVDTDDDGDMAVDIGGEAPAISVNSKRAHQSDEEEGDDDDEEDESSEEEQRKKPKKKKVKKQKQKQGKGKKAQQTFSFAGLD